MRSAALAVALGLAASQCAAEEILECWPVSAMPLHHHKPMHHRRATEPGHHRKFRARHHSLCHRARMICRWVEVDVGGPAGAWFADSGWFEDFGGEGWSGGGFGEGGDFGGLGGFGGAGRGREGLPSFGGSSGERTPAVPEWPTWTMVLAGLTLVGVIKGWK